MHLPSSTPTSTCLNDEKTDNMAPVGQMYLHHARKSDTTVKRMDKTKIVVPA
jgi:hypothetical protein